MLEPQQLLLPRNQQNPAGETKPILRKQADGGRMTTDMQRFMYVVHLRLWGHHGILKFYSEVLQRGLCEALMPEPQ